jgi:hypothetical protein
MRSMKKIQMMMISTAISLTACQKNSLGEVKSLDYYSNHIEEAQKIIPKCDDLAKKELSVMSPSQRMSWEETPDGINCRNAKETTQKHKWAERQRQMREAAEKYR